MICFILYLLLSTHQREVEWLIFTMLFEDSYAKRGIFPSIADFFFHFQVLQMPFCNAKLSLITIEILFFLSLFSWKFEFCYWLKLFLKNALRISFHNNNKNKENERTLNKNGIVSMNRFSKRMKSMLWLSSLPVSFQVYFVE